MGEQQLYRTDIPLVLLLLKSAKHVADHAAESCVHFQLFTTIHSAISAGPSDCMHADSYCR